MKPAPFRYVAARSLEQALDAKGRIRRRGAISGRRPKPGSGNEFPADAAGSADRHQSAEGVCRRTEERRGPFAHRRADALPQPRTRPGNREPTCRSLHEALPHIAHPQIRNRGTIGGNLAHADPASEMPAIVLALGGRLRAQSVRGERWIEAPIFLSARSPRRWRTTRCWSRWSCRSRRRAPAPALWKWRAAAATSPSSAWPARCGSTPRDAAARRGSACATPAIRRSSSPQRGESLLVGERIERARRSTKPPRSCRRSIDPGGNVHASSEYQRHIAGVLTARALATRERTGAAWALIGTRSPSR